MINTSLAKHIIRESPYNRVGVGSYYGSYNLTYELQYEKFLDVLHSRMFDCGKNVNYDIVLSGNTLTAGGDEVSINEDLEVYLDRYDMAYGAGTGKDYYSRLILELEKLGIFDNFSIYEDELAELSDSPISGDGQEGFDEIMRDYARTFLSKRELLRFDTKRFSEAVPEFVDELCFEWDCDPTMETSDKYYIVFESSIIGKLLSLDVTDSELDIAKKLLSNAFLGLHTRVASDGTFYCWGIFGADEMEQVHLCDLPLNSGAQVALVMALAERYGLISKKEDIELCEKVAA
ncbi:hypothetical protein [Butyrivibrio proteoclasticus]|uniref:hypothetical protein n=1 Tax=Butyrivibrio proteoclasticus TaxID=43305 RepID=UPI00047D92FF|nr:hypothetical protein [Butyrivibrio proteoclasticus]